MSCGILDEGFVRMACPDCHKERLLPFSCKSRGFCPSCSKKRQLLFAEYFCDHIAEDVGHRHLVFTIPKRLRWVFARHKNLLHLLATCAYESYKLVMQEASGCEKDVGGAVCCLQTFGTWLDYHPHVHMLATWGSFDQRGGYTGANHIPKEALEAVFSEKLFNALIAEGLISEELKFEMRSWKHSGFGVFVGSLIWAQDREGLECVASYIAKGPLALHGLELKGDKVILQGPPQKHHPKYQDGIRSWHVMDFIADLVQHIPKKDAKLTLYYGWYSIRSRSYRKQHPEKFITKPVKSKTGACQGALSMGHWRRFIKKVYEVDPLLCEHCGVKMRQVANIFDPDVIFKILNHLDLLDKDWGSVRGPP